MHSTDVIFGDSSLRPGWPSVAMILEQGSALKRAPKTVHLDSQHMLIGERSALCRVQDASFVHKTREAPPEGTCQDIIMHILNITKPAITISR